MRRSAWAVLLCAAAAGACSSSAPSTVSAAPGTPFEVAARSREQAPACPAGSTCRLVGANGGAETAAAYLAQCSGRFPDSIDLVPANYTGRRFVLSQDYPAAVPAIVTAPWLKIDFKTDAGAVQYMMALREYVYAGMADADWQGEKNQVRKWYHVPWMSPGKRPREFVRGMTEERPLSGPELGVKKGRTVQNWAIGYYNDVGAVSLGRVFATPSAPDPTKAASAVGTVVAKVLFSAAVADDFDGADILEGSPAWQANIIARRTPFEKKIGSVRLLQMDVAARDPRATETGWVFGTFAYDRAAKGANGWDKMIPVGLMWGSDPKRLPTANTPPAETRINAAAPAYALNHLGWAQRMNGPVDNPVSACLACHSTAQVPNVLTSMTPMRGCTDAQKLHWFRNLRGNQPFGGISASCQPQPPAGVVALDYSLQLSVALNAIASGEFVNPCGAGPGPRGAAAPLSKGQKVYDVIR
jgi:hypothetical protein